MATVPIHEQALVQGGNSVFEDVWITDTLHYDFKRSGNVEFNSLSVSGTCVLYWGCNICWKFICSRFKSPAMRIYLAFQQSKKYL